MADTIAENKEVNIIENDVCEKPVVEKKLVESKEKAADVVPEEVSIVDEISKKTENGNLKNGSTDEADHKDEKSKEAENGNSTENSNGVCKLKRKSISDAVVSDAKKPDEIVEKKLKVDDEQKDKADTTEVKNGDVETVDS